MEYRKAITADLAVIFRYATAGLNIDEVKDEFMMALREAAAIP